MDAGDARGKALAAINVTPMIDVLLVLLIIFMVITPAMQRGLDSRIPQPPKTDAPTLPSTVVVEVLRGAGGEPVYRVNQTAVPQSQMLAELNSVFAQRSDKTMFVKGDAALTFKEIAAVVDLGHQAGVESVALMTRGLEEHN